MKKLLIIFFIWFSASAQDIAVKSLQVYTESFKSLPVVTNNKLKIEFDIQGNYQPNLIINFRFCNSNWEPYDNTFLLNQGFNTAYNLWFDNIPVISDDIRYHYYGEFPNVDVTFPFSGKWKFFIAESNDPDVVYAEGRFYVIKPEMPVQVQMDKYRIERNNRVNNALERAYELQVDFLLPDSLYPMDLNYVEVIENQKLDYPVDIKKDKYGKYRFYDTDGNRGFTFYARDILPGNEYRQTDLRNKDKYQPPLTDAQFDGIEYSRFYQYGPPDNNGGFKTVNFVDDYADYMMVKFRFSPTEPEDDVYLVGSFTDWKVLPENRMEDKNGIYEITFELKRGIYDYQYVTGYIYDNETDLDWYKYEGNFWETSNDYYIFVYYKSQENGGYDKIIGYRKINSGNL